MSADLVVDPGRVYTIAETAEILRVATRTLYGAAARGEVPTVRIGRRLVVPGAALMRLLEGESTR